MRSGYCGMILQVSEQFSSGETLSMWRKMCRAHYFDLGFKEFVDSTGNRVVKMPFYLSVGQEAISAALATVFPEAILFPQHRCHDIYLSWGGDVDRLADELMHLESGCSGGKGGSASIHIPGRIIGHDGFMGTQVRDAVGRALGSKLHGSEELIIAFTGDASAEEGYVLGPEGFAATRKAPVLFVCADNGLSILTKKDVRRSWQTEKVAEAFDMCSFEITDNPWLIMHHLKKLQKDDFPVYFNIHTCRHLWHNGTGNDGPPEWDRFAMTHEECARLGFSKDADSILEEAKKEMLEMWARRLREFKRTYIEIPPLAAPSKVVEERKKTSAETISSLTRMHLEKGLGVAAGQCLTAVGYVQHSVPEVTQEEGLFETSMDDTSWPGIMVGMASREFRPILIVRFQGFLWFNAEVIANRAAISKFMWNEPRPVLMRAIARDGGVGPVASGSHHSLLTRMPGVYVYAPMTPDEYTYGYTFFMEHDDPMLFSEHQRGLQIDYEMENIVHRPPAGGADLTIFAISSTRLNAATAIRPLLEEYGIICNLVHVTWLKPFEITNDMRIAMQNSTHGGLILDGDFENGHIKCMAYDLMCATGQRVRVLGLENHPAGFSPATDNFPPTKEKIIAEIRKIIGK